MPIQFTIPEWVTQIYVDEKANYEILDDSTLRELDYFEETDSNFAVLVTGASGMYFESISGKDGMSFRVCPKTAAGINLAGIDDILVRAMDKKSGDVYIHGSPKAQYELGVMFYTMYNAVQYEFAAEDKEAQSYGIFNLTQAAFWLNRAANEDYAPAQFLLYYIKFWCMGEHGTAYVWLDKAVQNGYSKAQAMQAAIFLNNVMSYSRTKDKGKKKESTKMFKSAFDLASKSAFANVKAEIYPSACFRRHIFQIRREYS